MPAGAAKRSRSQAPSAHEPVWADLSDGEQELLLAAITDEVLGVECERLPGLDLMVAAARLVDLGLLWFYRVGDGYPDLGPAEVASLCLDRGWWDSTGTDRHTVGIHLTDAGERLLLPRS